MGMEINSLTSDYKAQYAKEAISLDKKTNDNSQISKEQISKEYLQNLRIKYPDVNITVVDFKSEKQELSYMLGCSGGNNIAISANIIDKMANDPDVAARYEKVIEKLPQDCKEIKENIESEPGCTCIACGVKIDKNGKVTYWSVGKKVGEGPGTKEKFQKELEERRTLKKKKAKEEAIKQKKVLEKQALEEKIKSRHEENKQLTETLLAKGDSVNNTVKKFINGKADVLSDDLLNMLELGGRINLSV